MKLAGHKTERVYRDMRTSASRTSRKGEAGGTPRPDFPAWFGSYEDAEAFCQRFFP